MDCRFKLVAFAAIFVCGSAHAGYAQLAPPSNWKTNSVKVNANDTFFRGGFRSGVAGANVGGRSISMPVAYRLAANAGKFAARTAYMNPAIFAAVTVGSLAYSVYDFYKENGFEVVNGEWKKKIDTSETYFTYYGSTTQHSSPSAAGLAYTQATLPNGYTITGTTVCTGSGPYNCNTPISAYGNPSTSSVVVEAHTTEGGARYEDTNAAEMETQMQQVPLPITLPQAFPVPDIYWPVDPKPIVNPTPITDPEAVPLPQPYRVPLGEPLPVPGTDPVQYKQPVLDIVPAPTPTEPWRVDNQSRDIIKLDLFPEDEGPKPVYPPEGTTETTSEQDICQKYPDIAGCQKLDVPDSDDIGTKDINVTVNPESGFDSAGWCPADVATSVPGVSFSYAGVCQGLGMLRPIIIAIAWLTAGMILLGVRGGSE